MCLVSMGSSGIPLTFSGARLLHVKCISVLRFVLLYSFLTVIWMVLQ